MDSKLDYLKINRESWNNKVDSHLESDFYDLQGFLRGESSLKQIELEMLGDVKGKSILHLQCHFGQDSISLSRMGASVVGVDLSDKAIESATTLAAQLMADATFICCDVYDLPKHLNQKFDIVFTSYGVIGWLPDLEKWAAIVSHFLKPEGKFVFVEFHPVVWMFDNEFEKVEYHYLKSDPIVEVEDGSYADRSADINQTTITWNHGIGEVVNSLLHAGMEINSLEEYDFSPYNCFRHTKEVASGKFVISHLENKIPMVYSVMATKK